MELIRLRRRLVLAERGHKLLKDKLEEIMRRFLRLVRELYNLQEIVSLKLKKVFLSFALVRGREIDFGNKARKDFQPYYPSI
jgi:V/A-type H+-transporting ATPase subunit D